MHAVLYVELFHLSSDLLWQAMKTCGANGNVIGECLWVFPTISYSLC